MSDDVKYQCTGCVSECILTMLIVTNVPYHCPVDGTGVEYKDITEEK